MDATTKLGGEITNLKGSDKPMMIVSFYRHFNLRLGEWLASLIIATLGIVLMNAPNMFAQTPQYFSGMRADGTEFEWGIWFAIIGITRICALYVNGRKPITPYIRMLFAFVSCFAWFELALSLILSGIPGLGWGVFPWLLALDMYNVFRSSADAREVFDRTRAKRNDGTKTA